MLSAGETFAVTLIGEVLNPLVNEAHTYTDKFAEQHNFGQVTVIPIYQRVQSLYPDAVFYFQRKKGRILKKNVFDHTHNRVAFQAEHEAHSSSGMKSTDNW